MLLSLSTVTNIVKYNIDRLFSITLPRAVDQLLFVRIQNEVFETWSSCPDYLLDKSTRSVRGCSRRQKTGKETTASADPFFPVCHREGLIEIYLFFLSSFLLSAWFLLSSFDLFSKGLLSLNVTDD